LDRFEEAERVRVAALGLFADQADATSHLETLAIPLLTSTSAQSSLGALISAVVKLPEQHAKSLQKYRLQLRATLVAGNTYGTCTAFRGVWDQCARHDDSLLLMRVAFMTRRCWQKSVGYCVLVKPIQCSATRRRCGCFAG
jgi:hypothetical protein